MNYDKVIVELLARIQVLEEQVSFLLSQKEETKEESIVTTKDIREHIEKLKIKAKQSKQTTLVLTARDVHGELELKSRYPMVCNAMRQCMNDDDRILFQPPKGNSSTLMIEYKL